MTAYDPTVAITEMWSCLVVICMAVLIGYAILRRRYSRA